MLAQNSRKPSGRAASSNAEGELSSSAVTSRGCAETETLLALGAASLFEARLQASGSSPGPSTSRARRRRSELGESGIGTVEQTKLVTAGSELTRNILKYARRGEVQVITVTDGRRVGVRAVFSDEGPGIAEIALAMQDGYSTGKGLGLGLPGTRRLVDHFEIVSAPGQGTTVTITKWCR